MHTGYRVICVEDIGVVCFEDVNVVNWIMNEIILEFFTFEFVSLIRF